MTDSAASTVRVVAQTVDVANRSVLSTDEQSLGQGESLLIGREGDLAVGTTAPDTGVSRRALVVCPGTDGWHVESMNSNGAILHPWAQAERWLTPGEPEDLRWPRIGIRLVGSRPGLHHWVLLESDAYTIDPVRAGTSTNTETPRPPLPLTDAQLAALTTVFAQHLAWPPVAGPLLLTLQAAARRLGISEAAVYQRLEAVQARAYQLGLHRQHGVTDPDYLYLLVRHGYLPAPTTTVAELERPSMDPAPLQ